MFNHIAYNHEILSGKPYIAGTRLSIEFILELFASGGTKEEILKTYPQLSAEAIEEVMRLRFGWTKKTSSRERIGQTKFAERFSKVISSLFAFLNNLMKSKAFDIKS